MEWVYLINQSTEHKDEIMMIPDKIDTQLKRVKRNITIRILKQVIKFVIVNYI